MSQSHVSAFSKFDQRHWALVRAERIRLNLDKSTSRESLPGHPLVGARVADARNGETYRIKSVQKEWRQGWFLTAALVSAKDDCQKFCSCVCVVENLSCQDEVVLDMLGNFKVNYRLLA